MIRQPHLLLHQYLISIIFITFSASLDLSISYTMFVESVSASSLSTRGESSIISSFFGSNSLSSSSKLRSASTCTLSFSPRNGRKSFKVAASSETNNYPLTGVVFQPFEEVKKEVLAAPVAPQLSLGRQYYREECEAAINEQIK